MDLTKPRYYKSNRLWPPPPANCVLYYPGFPPAGSTLTDFSGNDYDGTITGASWTRLDTGAYCLDYNSATPDYVEIPATATELDFTSEDFSIVTRARFDDYSSDITLMCRTDGTPTDGWVFGTLNWAGLSAKTYQTGASQISYTGGGSLTTATWYTLGMSRDGASIKLYIDGVDGTVSSGTHVNPESCASKAYVGIWIGLAAGKLDGKLLPLIVFSGVALTTAQQLYWHQRLQKVTGV